MDLEDENMSIVKDLLASLESGDTKLMASILETSSANVEQILATYTLPNTNKQYTHEPEILQDAHTLLGPSVHRLNLLQVACFLGEEELALMLINHLTNGASIGSKHALTACLSSIWGNNNNTLHLASFLGMADLVNRILRLSPKLGLKKNDRGYRPVHCTDDPQTAMIFKQVDDMLICNSTLQLATDSTTDLATTSSSKNSPVVKLASRPSTSISRSILSRSSDCLTQVSQTTIPTQSVLPKKKKSVSFDPLTLWFQAAELGDLALLTSTFTNLPPSIKDRTIDTRLCSRGATAFLVACANGHIAALSWILNHGGDPNVIDDVGNSALHYAVSSDALFLDLVLALIDLPVFLNMDVVNFENEHFVQLVDQDDNVDGVQFVIQVKNALELRRTKGPGLGPSLKLSTSEQNSSLPPTPSSGQMTSTSSITANIPGSSDPSTSTNTSLISKPLPTQSSKLPNTTTTTSSSIKPPSRPPLPPLPLSSPTIPNPANSTNVRILSPSTTSQPCTNLEVEQRPNIGSSGTTGSVPNLTIESASRKPNQKTAGNPCVVPLAPPVLRETYTSPFNNSGPAEITVQKDMINLPTSPVCPQPAKPTDSSSITPACEPTHIPDLLKTDHHPSPYHFGPVPLKAKHSSSIHVPEAEPQRECHVSEPSIQSIEKNQHDQQRRQSSCTPKQPPVRTPSPFRLDRKALFNSSSSGPAKKREDEMKKTTTPESFTCYTATEDQQQLSGGGGLDRTSSLSYRSPRSCHYHLPPSATIPNESSGNNHSSRPILSRLGLKKEKRGANVTNISGALTPLSSPTDTACLRAGEMTSSSTKKRDEVDVPTVRERRQFWMFMGRAAK